MMISLHRTPENTVDHHYIFTCPTLSSCKNKVDCCNEICHLICNTTNMMGATRGAGTTYPSGTPKFSLV